MFNAPCGVRSPVSERKRSLCLGLCYVLEIQDGDLNQNAALLLTTSTRAVCAHFDGGRRTRTNCHYGNQ
ncbi:hypothetical protein CHARACLAT_000563 [Characodon lateralis]|uniref:Uncharacterized protein n=1 Tax=Characodon lateralis TaxID=208331 RepID=A0ABU7EPS5_9TELE|nr:hypothetical protein [Characodon lateralis]